MVRKWENHCKVEKQLSTLGEKMDSTWKVLESCCPIAHNTLIKWKPIGERILLVRIFTSNLSIQVYRPNKGTNDEEKTTFWEHLHSVLEKTITHRVKVERKQEGNN
jgi:hypothetical protein